MKSLILSSFLVMSFNVSAYEIVTGSAKIPAKVIEAVRVEVDAKCEGSANSLKTLKLETFSVERVRIDQGYLEDQYALAFSVTPKAGSFQTTEIFVRVINQIEDRSGQLDAFAVNFATESGDNCSL